MSNVLWQSGFRIYWWVRIFLKFFDSTRRPSFTTGSTAASVRNSHGSHPQIDFLTVEEPQDQPLDDQDASC